MKIISALRSSFCNGFCGCISYNSVVTTDGAWSRGHWVGGTEDLATDLAGLAALPDHGADGAGCHVGHQTLEEWLLGQVGVVLLEVLLAWGD